MLYVIQICSATRFALARDIDPAYGRAFDRARQQGVEAIAYRCTIDGEGLDVETAVPMLEQSRAA
jgi:sugar fermentation stimulation protein A